MRRRARARWGGLLAAFALLSSYAGRAAAQEQDAPEDASEALAARLDELEHRLADTQDLLQQRRPAVTVGGYVDLGFFATTGDGSGIVQDGGPAATRAFPQYANQYGWVFLGDLLAPAVNSRGEPADLGQLPGVNRASSLQSGGAPTFVVNEVNLRLEAALGGSALITTSLDFLPRSGSDFRLGDLFEVDLAQVEWMPGRERRTSLFVGKMESVLGIEYRERKASQRFGITPSLLARYTTGTPLGLKVRSKWGEDDWLVVAVALTNGSSTIETFHFYDETDSNAAKTLSARLSAAPWRRLELGVSGAWGAQDHAPDSRGPLWFFGIDLQGHFEPVELKGQWLVGHGAGETGRVYAEPHRPFGLDLRSGAYLEADVLVSPTWGFLVRGEMRDARVWLGDPAAPGGAERLYVTKGWRATAGVRYQPHERALVKAELLHNGEYGGVPQIRDDVFTSSLVLVF